MVKWTFFIYLLPAVVIGLFKSESWDAGETGEAGGCIIWGVIGATHAPYPLFIFILADGRGIALAVEFALVFALVRYFSCGWQIPPQKNNKYFNSDVYIAADCVFPGMRTIWRKCRVAWPNSLFRDDVLKGAMEWPLGSIWGYYLESGGPANGSALAVTVCCGVRRFFVEPEKI